jgi:hypothetical protein
MLSADIAIVPMSHWSSCRPRVLVLYIPPFPRRSRRASSVSGSRRRRHPVCLFYVSSIYGGCGVPPLFFPCPPACGWMVFELQSCCQTIPESPLHVTPRLLPRAVETTVNCRPDTETRNASHEHTVGLYDAGARRILISVDMRYERSNPGGYVYQRIYK